MYMIEYRTALTISPLSLPMIHITAQAMSTKAEEITSFTAC